jgi:hypothetical protein
LGSSEGWAGAAQTFMRRAGIDPGSVPGLQMAGRGLGSQLGNQDKAINWLRAGLWNARNIGDKAGAKTIREELKEALAGREETLTQIAENTRATTEAIKDATLSQLRDQGSLAGTVNGLATSEAGKGLLARFFPGGMVGGLNVADISTTGGLNKFLEGVAGELFAGGDLGGGLSLLGQIAQSTDAIAQNTQDLSDFWKAQAYRLAQGLAVSQAQYGVFKNFDGAPTPYLGGFDSGGIVPGPMGQPGYALVHGGETILPTHKQSAPMVNVYVSADARAAGVRVDAQVGRDARQLSIAPGR